jgi:hypothetical protein
MSGGPDATVVASNYRAVGKGHLLGVVDLTLTRWKFRLVGCLHFEKGDKQWVSLPTRRWVDDDGTRQFSPLGEFLDPADATRFSREAIAAVELIIPSAASPARSPPNGPPGAPDRESLPDDPTDDLWPDGGVP